MRSALALILVVGLVVPASVAARKTRDRSVSHWINLAVATTQAHPGCGGQTGEETTTDAPVPDAVLRRYAILRQPAPDSLPSSLVLGDGPVASYAARSHTVDGLEVIVTPILGWKPTVWPLSCDRFLTRELDRLLRDERSPARRAAARLFAQESAARQAAARVQAPRTLLSLGVSALGPPTAGPFPSVAITGLFARSQRGFPTGTTVAPAFDGTIFVGLVPDGVARIRFRATDKPDIEFPVDTNIVVARFSFARSQVGLEQQVWLAADGSVLRTVGRLR